MPDQRALERPRITSIAFRRYKALQEFSISLSELRKEVELAWIHDCKEVENFLLAPRVLQRAIAARLAERAKRSGAPTKEAPDVTTLLEEVTLPTKAAVAGQYLARRSEYLRKKNPSLDIAASNAEVMTAFEKDWGPLESRLRIVSGKQVLADLNEKLQKSLGISLSAAQICAQFKKEEVPEDLKVLLKRIKDFSEKAPPK